ncbi:MAG: bifunctional 4-hydroxy-2-oxoglutarate aldolase/2-dehydro-3-deoxy-phosphogluconate aldolase [Pseudomonadota bacterium]
MEKRTARILEIMNLAPVIPVVTIHDVVQGVELARALVRGGLPTIEVTLRTEAAMPALKAIASDVEGAVVGAGTVLSPALLEQSVMAGAKFLVSPGGSQELLDAASKTDTPLLPGVATPSEAMGLGEMGYNALKFFPAEQAGGASYLKAISAPLPQFTFCPTGGVTPQNAQAYLRLPNVACVGGSWVAPKDLVAAGEWDRITDLAREAASLQQ